MSGVRPCLLERRPLRTDEADAALAKRRGQRYNQGSMNRRVSLFVTCVVDQLFPHAGLAMADVLQRIGWAVDFPEAQTCCGQPAFNSGYREEARLVARHFLKVFRDAEYIVVPSGSCTAMITHHFEDIFHKEPETLAQVHEISRRVWEFSQFLLEVAGSLSSSSRKMLRMRSMIVTSSACRLNAAIGP